MAAVDPASAEAQEQAEDRIDQAAIAAEMLVLEIVAARLLRMTTSNDNLQRSEWANADLDAIRNALAKGRAAVQMAVASVFEDMGRGNDEWAKPYYEAAGAERSAEADAALIEGRKAAQAKVGELCRTSVIGLADRDGKPEVVDDRYKAMITRSVMRMRAGAGTPMEEVARAVAWLSKSGARVMYASGNTRELFAAVRMNVMDGYRTTMVAQRMEHGKAFGADGVEVSAHSPCAPDHQPWQGRRYTDEQWRQLEAKLSGRPLVTGANCKHTVWPVIVGIGKQARSDEKLREMRDESNEVVSFTSPTGEQLSMTRYEATQHQRRTELSIRRARAEAYLDTRNGDKGAAEKASGRAEALTRYYRSMSATVGLSTRMERTKLYVMS